MNKILGEGEGNRFNLHPLLTVGFTENNEIGIFWNNDELRRSIINRSSVAQLSALKDAITIAVRDSLNKRMPTIFTVS